MYCAIGPALVFAHNPKTSRNCLDTIIHQERPLSQASHRCVVPQPPITDIFPLRIHARPSEQTNTPSVQYSDRRSESPKSCPTDGAISYPTVTLFPPQQACPRERDNASASLLLVYVIRKKRCTYICVAPCDHLSTKYSYRIIPPPSK